MPRRNIIGERVRMARERAKPSVTQTDLAARLQVEGLRLERVTISKIETGYREVTDVEAMAIAKALGVSISWLMGESSNNKSN
ncbi:helix-turn-helix transcriptional regulator [bacterium]|nr:helix-turn-helix transcriptional regulator [bacterium]